jgi:hypothetical protein
MATRPSRKAPGRAVELAAQDDHNGAATWRRITAAVEQLANKIPVRTAALTGTARRLCVFVC